MIDAAETVTGWIVTGFQAQVLLWIWIVLVLLYGLYRSTARPEADSIRSAGPIG